MNLLSKNLKKAGIFNTVLILIAIGFRAYQLIDCSMLVKIDGVLCILALLFGVFYSFDGYKKDAGKYYRGFMGLYFISSVVSIATPIEAILDSTYVFDEATIIAIFNIVIAVCIFLLGFKKDLGKEKSLNLSYAVVALDIGKLAINLFIKASMSIISIDVSNLVLGLFTCAFVIVKYLDKQSRGSK